MGVVGWYVVVGSYGRGVVGLWWDCMVVVVWYGGGRVL